MYPHATPNNQVNIAALHVDGLRLERQSSAITAFESHNHPVHTVFEGVVAMKEGDEEEEAEEEGGRRRRSRRRRREGWRRKMDDVFFH